ncbi:DUF397 domain-containing protein [Streptomyces sp. NPDC001852]|uniref:DUF397 domain-containing protein n=1 Tax=Streptomyces sp. NPDC001852 TaxID=3364619 RepID=UPI0036BB5701
MRNIPDHDLSTTVWRKSSYSGNADNCLEVADAHPTLIPVRDSKTPHGPKLVFRPTTWSAFVDHLKRPQS